MAATSLALAAVQVGPAATWLPSVRRWLTPSLSGRAAVGGLVLTFDDGPHPVATPKILEALDTFGWTATFFVLGEQARRYPDVVRETARRGHDVAVHGDAHRYLIARTPAAAARDLRRAYDTVGDIAGVAPRWWRPPYGVLSGPALIAARTLGLRPLLWSAWGRDWRAEATAESVVRDLRRGGLDGGTLLLHDSDVTSAPGSWCATLDSLGLLAEELAAARLRVRAISEHLGP